MCNFCQEPINANYHQIYYPLFFKFSYLSLLQKCGYIHLNRNTWIILFLCDHLEYTLDEDFSTIPLGIYINCSECHCILEEKRKTSPLLQVMERLGANLKNSIAFSKSWPLNLLDGVLRDAQTTL